MSHRVLPSFAKRILFVGLVALLGVVLLVRDLTTPSELPPLLRIDSPIKGEETLQVPVVRYTKGGWFGSDVTVDLVGAVHLGEKRYFEELNTRFTTYDAVLYELIAEPDRVADLRSMRSDSTLGMIQRKLAEMLGLEFQLDTVDYTPANFVHADMTPLQLAAAMQKRGETISSLLIKLLKLSFDPALQRSLEDSGFSGKELEGINPLMLVLRGPTQDEQFTLRRFMAHGLVASDKVLKVLEGESGGVIIADRNAVAVRELVRQFDWGKKRIAVYYGVGHIPDLHKRLTEELGLRYSSIQWIPAWRLSK